MTRHTPPRRVPSPVRGFRAKIALREILRIVAEETEYEVDIIKGHSRSPSHVGARHVAMWLARQLTSMSYPEIAREFGHRHHTSVHYAVCMVDQLRQSDPEMRTLTDQLFARLVGG